MKKIIILILVLLALVFAVSAQTDSTFESKYKAEIQGLRQEINESYMILQKERVQIGEIKLHLRDCHQEYRRGLNTFWAGMGVSLVGLIPTIIGYNNDDNFLQFTGIAVVGVGGILSTVGGALMINSHKHIGRAGKERLDD